MSDAQRPSENWEDAEAPPNRPMLQSSHYVASYNRFYKRFQLQVLICLGVFILFLLIFESFFLKGSLKDVLSLILPLFTFVLGMGSQTEK